MSDFQELRTRGRNLRKEMTKEERHLWYDFLKTQSRQWKRQFIFEPYIVDFYCPSAKLVVELDGGQHYEENALAYDAERTKVLQETYGLKVIRFTNLEINRQFQACCEAILKEIG